MVRQSARRGMPPQVVRRHRIQASILRLSVRERAPLMPEQLLPLPRTLAACVHVSAVIKPGNPYYSHDLGIELVKTTCRNAVDSTKGILDISVRGVWNQRVGA